MTEVPITTSAPETPAPASTPLQVPRNRRVHRLTRRDKITIAVMVGIPTLVELLLVWLPTVLSVLLSFTKWNGLELGNIRGNGLANYHYVFSESPDFWPAIWHNVLWLLVLSFVATPLGLLLAALLDQQLRGTRIYQTIFFVPVMLSLALTGIIWQLMYSRDDGLINNLLGTANTPHAVDWLGTSGLNIWAALVAATWKHVGYIMILYLAGLKGVDPSIKEAAALDGANERQTFFRVVFPAMRPINIIVVVITLIESLRAFDIAWVINGGSNGLQLISTLIINNLIGEGQVIGVGSALAVILLVVALVPIITYLNRTFRAEED